MEPDLPSLSKMVGYRRDDRSRRAGSPDSQGTLDSLERRKMWATANRDFLRSGKSAANLLDQSSF